MNKNSMILDKKLDSERLINKPSDTVLGQKVYNNNFSASVSPNFYLQSRSDKDSFNRSLEMNNRKYRKRVDENLISGSHAGIENHFTGLPNLSVKTHPINVSVREDCKKVDADTLLLNPVGERAGRHYESKLNYGSAYRQMAQKTKAEPSAQSVSVYSLREHPVSKHNGEKGKEEFVIPSKSLTVGNESRRTLKRKKGEIHKHQPFRHVEDTVLILSSKVRNEDAEDDAALEGLKKSVDLGIQTKHSIQRSVMGIRKSAGLTSKANQRMKSARQSFVRAKKAKETKEKISEAYSVSKNIVIAVSNMLKATVELIAAAPVVFIIIGVLALICVLGTSLSSFLMTQHSASPETLSSIYQYVKEKSTDVGYEFQNYKRVHSPAFDDIEDADVTLDARVTPFSEPTDKIVNYFSAKYEDELSLEIAKDEIDAIMSSLFTISHEIGERTEVIEKEVEKPVLDDDGEPVLDGDGNPLTETVIEMEEKTFRTLRVILDGITFEEWFEANAHLDKVQKQRYDIFNEMQNLGVGGAGNIGNINSPFPDSWSVSSPFGSRVNPKTGEREFHRGVDIPKPGGTPIYAVASGTVTSTTGHWTYGNTFVITGTAPDGTLSVRYAHCQSFVVHDGQSIKAGDLVGYVGTTGASTGNHLHIEMLLNGTLINPMLYLQNPGAI